MDKQLKRIESKLDYIIKKIDKQERKQQPIDLDDGQIEYLERMMERPE